MIQSFDTAKQHGRVGNTRFAAMKASVAELRVLDYHSLRFPETPRALW